MAFTKPEKAFCILEFAKTESWTLVQCAFRTKFQKEATERKSMLRWHGKFMKDGCLCVQLRQRDAPQLQMIRLSEFEVPSSGAPVNRSEGPVGNFSFLQQLFGVSLKRRLHMTPYKLQLVQQLKDTDIPARHDLRCNAREVGR